jgi:hypothetical protein
MKAFAQFVQGGLAISASTRVFDALWRNPPKTVGYGA